MTPLPPAGTTLRLDRCTVQFTNPTTARFVRVNAELRSSYDGWAWIDVLMLDSNGDATTKRSLFLPIDRLAKSITPPIIRLPIK